MVEKGPWTGCYHSLTTLTLIHFLITQNPRLKLPRSSSPVTPSRYRSQKTIISRRRRRRRRTSVFLHYRMEKALRAISRTGLLQCRLQPTGRQIKQNRRVLTIQNIYFHAKNQHCRSRPPFRHHLPPPRMPAYKL